MADDIYSRLADHIQHGPITPDTWSLLVAARDEIDRLNRLIRAHEVVIQGYIEELRRG